MVPIHFNSNGIADRFVGKSNYEVVLLCSLGFISIVFMKLLSQNIIKKSEEAEKDNTETTKLLMSIMLFLVTFLFSAISVYFLITIADIYKLKNINLLKMSSIFIGILFIILGQYMPKFKQNSILGFRTKSTLKNKIIWNKTQKRCEIIWIIGGIIIVCISLFSVFNKNVSTIFLLSVNFSVFTLIIVIPLVYSYHLNKKI